ncbi:MAG: hypothetical protein Q9182_005025 [Xanthomendoza sp. 2 TL-2023]
MATSRGDNAGEGENSHANVQPSETTPCTISLDPFDVIDHGHTAFDQSITPVDSSDTSQVLAAGDETAGTTSLLDSDSELNNDDDENTRNNDEKLTKFLSQVRDKLAQLGVQVKEAHYAEMVEKAKAWIAAHPYQTAFQVIMFILTLSPGLLAGPALGVAGFSSGGVVAGSAAVARQAAIGNVAGRSTFAVLQSAGAGGYGVPIVHGVVRAGSVIVGTLGAVAGRFRKGKKPDCSNKL